MLGGRSSVDHTIDKRLRPNDSVHLLSRKDRGHQESGALQAEWRAGPFQGYFIFTLTRSSTTVHNNDPRFDQDVDDIFHFVPACRRLQ